MSEISELFSRNVLERPHTDEELERIIAHLREQRKAAAERIAQGLPPQRPKTAEQIERERARIAAREAKEAEREAKAKAKAEKAAAKVAKRDPRQVDLEEAIVATKQSPPAGGQQPANGDEDAPQP